MSGPTTTSILPPAVQQQLSMKLLARPMPDLIHTTMGYPITMDQQAGDILRRRRYQNLATAPVPLGNGIVDPPAQQLVAFLAQLKSLVIVLNALIKGNKGQAEHYALAA
jgi:hypothetical protein